MSTASSSLRSTSPSLVATTGPASFGSEPQLLSIGATSIRINASHLAPTDVVTHCERILAISPAAECVVDLQGAKMRLGQIAPVEVRAGDRIRLSCREDERSALHVPHVELFDQVEAGETLVIDDGRLEAQVVERHPGALVVRAARDYIIRPRKGINRAAHPIKLSDLSENDRKTIAGCQHLTRVNYAISFVVDGSEAAWVRSRVPNAKLTLKVERQEAIDNLAMLADVADELWILSRRSWRAARTDFLGSSHLIHRSEAAWRPGVHGRSGARASHDP
ncbi:MAG: pyruvate kinase [Polyangiaceae bacterium]